MRCVFLINRSKRRISSDDRCSEAIFNSGMVNPPRDEIRKIRAQLQEYGQVGDANVFYWFQNRKSRSKHKQRQLDTSKSAAPSPSSSSSDKSSSDKSISAGPPSMIELLNSPTASVNQPFLQGSSEILAEPFYYSAPHNAVQEFCFPVAVQNPNFLLSELMLMSNCSSKKNEDEQFSYTPPNQTTLSPPSFCPSSDHLAKFFF